MSYVNQRFFLWTEHHDSNLKRTVADTILTINCQYTCHIEAQAYEDETMLIFDDMPLETILAAI